MAALSNAAVACLLLVTLLHLAVPSTPTQEFIDKTCSQGLKPSVCVSMLLRDRGSVFCPDIPCLVGIAANVIVDGVRNTSNYINVLLSRERGRDIAYSLERCQRTYASLTNYLEATRDATGRRDFQVAYERIGHAQGLTSECDVSFTDHPNMLTESNKRMADMVDVVFELLDQLVL